MSSQSYNPVVIAEIKRTPIGSFQGALSPLSAFELGSLAIRGVLSSSKFSPSDVSEVLMGCVLSAGQGQAPARQASLGAGLDVSVPCTTINKMCGSGLKTIMMACDALHARPFEVIIAGGMESMTNAPYLLPKARAGLRIGHSNLLDHMFCDGLEDAYDRGRLMGCFADKTASKYQFSRKAQDDFAITSLNRARKANDNGSFAAEMIAINVRKFKKEYIVNKDEPPFKAKIDKIPNLRPAFSKDGSVTAANSSSISDGAAVALMMREDQCAKYNINPKARVVATASFAQKPEWFTLAPVGAISKLLDKCKWKADEVDLYEINEAFAVVTMAAMHDHKIPHEKVNIFGGACALGHPIGASGCRIVATLVNAMHRYKHKKGIAALCIGGGEAVAIALEAY